MKILKAADAFDKSAKIDQGVNARSFLLKKGNFRPISPNLPVNLSFMHLIPFIKDFDICYNH